MTNPNNDPSPLVEGESKAWAVDAAVEYPAFRSWWACIMPTKPIPSSASHLFGAWMASARHRLTALRTPMPARVEPAMPADERYCRRCHNTGAIIPAGVFDLDECPDCHGESVNWAKVTDAPARVGEKKRELILHASNLLLTLSRVTPRRIINPNVPLGRDILETAERLAALATTPTNTTRAESEGA
jgi:hypothetical protein